MTTYTLWITKAEREALKGSIKKWEGIVAGTHKDEGVYDCPLCAMYNPLITGLDYPLCGKCPITVWSGDNGCDGTPHEEYCETEEGSKEEKAAAKKELSFLKNLLKISKELK